MIRSAAIISCITLLLLIVTSCRKEKGVDIEERKTLLTGVKWQTVSSFSIDSAGKETDLFTGLTDIMKDDYLIFNADSSYEINANLVVENDSVSRIIDAGNWRFTRDGNYIERYSTVYNTEYEPSEISELTQSSLVLLINSPSDRSRIRTRYQRIN